MRSPPPSPKQIFTRHSVKCLQWFFIASLICAHTACIFTGFISLLFVRQDPDMSLSLLLFVFVVVVLVWQQNLFPLLQKNIYLAVVWLVWNILDFACSVVVTSFLLSVSDVVSTNGKKEQFIIFTSNTWGV